MGPHKNDLWWIYVCVCLGNVKLFVLVNDGGGSAFGETAERARQTGARLVPAPTGPQWPASLDTHMHAHAHVHSTVTFYTTKCTYMLLNACLIVIYWRAHASESGNVQLSPVQISTDMHRKRVAINVQLVPVGKHWWMWCEPEMERRWEGWGRTTAKQRNQMLNLCQSANCPRH